MFSVASSLLKALTSLDNVSNGEQGGKGWHELYLTTDNKCTFRMYDEMNPPCQPEVSVTSEI